jgi:hypothetical protein
MLGLSMQLKEQYMLKAVEDAFTIIHIRISDKKVFGICARHFITGALIVFIIFNAIRVFTTVIAGDVFQFLEAGAFIILTVYFCLEWVSSWPKAGKMLNKAVKYEEEHNKKK